jgi:beta-N-acetylhexosaminidase
MRRIIIITIIILVLALSMIAVYNNFLDRNKKFRVDIRGTVTNINKITGAATILVEGKIESDTYYDKASVRIENNTLITKLSLSRYVDMSEIKVGDKVEVTFKGAVAESYPVQATAELVHIISDRGAI